MRCDLHNHSKFSDGKLSVKDLIDLAVSKNVDVMALTDHDSVFGVDEAYEYGKTKGVKVLKGLELSTLYKGQNVHIVTLFKNNKVPQAIYDFSKQIIDKRVNRAKMMMQKIEEIYHAKIDLDDLFKDSTVVTRGNMAQSLLRSNKNLTIDDINEMVSNDSKAYIPASKLSTEDGLKMLRDCGAICILAHPVLVKREYLREILDFGFDGIEARYPKNQDGDFQYFKDLAEEYNLFISAGSDFHGDQNHAMIGTSVLDEKEFEVIKNILELGDDF